MPLCTVCGVKNAWTPLPSDVLICIFCFEKAEDEAEKNKAANPYRMNDADLTDPFADDDYIVVPKQKKVLKGDTRHLYLNQDGSIKYKDVFEKLEGLNKPGKKGQRVASGMVHCVKKNGALSLKQWELALEVVSRADNGKRKTTPGVVSGFFVTNPDVEDLPLWWNEVFKTDTCPYPGENRVAYVVKLGKLELTSWSRSEVTFTLTVCFPSLAPVAKNKWHQAKLDEKARRSNWAIKKPSVFNIRVVRDCHNGDIIIVNVPDTYVRTACS